ncbi:MAG: hypothetical protein ACM31L_17985 [Actinomycetota bacterium]
MKDHGWKFFRVGGFDQVRLDRGSDILALDRLDQKLWVALACPASGLDFDSRTLALLDRDGDGRIRAADIVEAVRWLKKVLADPDELLRPGSELPLAAIDGDSEEGRRVLASARRILTNLGKPDAAAIDLDETRDLARIFGQTRFNGDGVVPVAAAEDDATRALIVDIIAAMGGVPDRSGAEGVDQQRVDDFFAAIDSLSEWWGKMPPGAATLEATDALAAVRDKVDDFFLRCRLAAYSPAAAEVANPRASDLDTLARRPLAERLDDLEALPLATCSPGATLPLGDGLNPVWRERMERLRSLVLGDAATLGEAEWAEVKARFAAVETWAATKPATPLDGMAAERIAAIRAQGRAEIDRLLGEDRAQEDEAAAIDGVERLVLYKRDLARLLDNFVSFREFYSRRSKAIFQAGTLYLDGRSCDLCIAVDDVDRHAQLATLSRIYLVYCACRRQGATMTIAAAITGGDSDQLMVGRNGVFYDRAGNDWDATVVKIVDHPIGLRQAFLAPYKRLGRFVAEQVEKVAQARAKAAQEAAAAKAAPPAAGAAPAPAKPPEAPPPFDVGRFAGVFAALGLAVGAIGTAIASVVTGFLALKWWQMPLALAGLALAVSGPSMVMAWMKLRQRNLGPILDANGWAVNTRAKINIPFGGSLTQVARLPEGAQRSLVDPYAEKGLPWGWMVFALLLAVAAGIGWWTWRSGAWAHAFGWG